MSDLSPAPTPTNEQQDAPFFRDLATGAPCPRSGPVLCTITDRDHLHRAIHMDTPTRLVLDEANATREHWRTVAVNAAAEVERLTAPLAAVSAAAPEGAHPGCDGSGACLAPAHQHGCHADALGHCNEPGEHTAAAPDERELGQRVARAILDDRQKRGDAADLDRDMYERGVQYGMSIAARIARTTAAALAARPAPVVSGEALETVKRLHHPVPVYPLLDLPGNPPDTDAAPLIVLCGECCDSTVLEDVEACCWSESAADVTWPCRTLAALGITVADAPAADDEGARA